MNQLNSSTTIGELSIWSVLGLSGHGTEEYRGCAGCNIRNWRWWRGRGFGHRRWPLSSRCCCFSLCRPSVDRRLAGALCASLTYSIRNEGQLSDADRRRMTSSEFRRQALGTIINALVWAAPLVFFVPYSPMHLRYEYWTVLAMLMTVSAVIVPTVPLSTLLFSTIVGCGSVVGFFTLLQPGMAGLRRCLLPRLRWARLRPRVIFCPRIWPLRAWPNAMKWSACSCANLTRMRLTGCGRPMRSAGFVPSRTVLPKRWAWRVPILMGPVSSLLSGPGGEGRAAEGRGVDRAGAPGIKELEEKLKARESFSNLWSG
jgi:hypothetical protein